MTESMDDKHCACGTLMFSVLTYDTPEHRPVRKGWFCASCRAWIATIGRERRGNNAVIPTEDKENGGK